MPGLRDLAKAISPNWLQSGVAEKYLYIIGLGMDGLLEKLNQGIKLRMPGYGDPSALPYISADRLITQGLTETTVAFATRLKAWLDAWQRAGSARSVLQQVRGYLAALTPMVRTVNDNSAWDTYSTTDNAQQVPPSHLRTPGSWNWDNEADPHPGASIAWWRWWLLLFADMTPVGGGVSAASTGAPIVITTVAAHGLASGQQVWTAGIGGVPAANSPNGNAPWTVTVLSSTQFALNGSTGGATYTGGGTVYLIGHNNWILPAPTVGAPGWVVGDPRYAVGFSLPNGAPHPEQVIASIRSLVALWKSAGSWCRWVVTSFDSNRFDPAQSADGTHNPDGTWGPWLKIVTVNGVSQYVPARSPDARYSDPVV